MSAKSRKFVGDDTEIATVPSLLEYYTATGKMTRGGGYATMLEALPRDVASLTRIVQGLALHEFVASGFYGVDVPEARRGESHIREVERMLERILAIDPAPLSVARPPEKRLVGVCHHFVLLLVAMMRAKGIPARARFGFGAYFNPGYFEDHSICEYWNASEARWILVDPQFDEIWRAKSGIDHDVLDVPRDRYLIPADAWTLCRTGKADPSKFGIFNGDLRGLWFIAGNLIRDLSALNKMEMLQWDVWGAMPRTNQQLQDDELAMFDQLAALTRDPDASFAELRERYDSDERLGVPPTVFNAVLNRPEAI
jgi:hypothetical protein